MTLRTRYSSFIFVAAVGGILWIVVVWQAEWLFSMPRTYVQGEVIKLVRMIDGDDFDGYAELLVDGEKVHVRFESNPTGPINTGDWARAVFREDFLGGHDLLELEVLHGEEPGIRLHATPQSYAVPGIIVAVAWTIVIGMVAWKTVTESTK